MLGIKFRVNELQLKLELKLEVMISAAEVSGVYEALFRTTVTHLQVLGSERLSFIFKRRKSTQKQVRIIHLVLTDTTAAAEVFIHNEEPSSVQTSLCLINHSSCIINITIA